MSGQKGVVWNVQGDEKASTYNQGYSTQQGYHLKLKEKWEIRSFPDKKKLRIC